jgi:phosphoserine phosphatase
MPENKDLLMVTVSGRDRPGIAAALSNVLVDHQVNIVDIEQASLQDLLGLSILVDISKAKSSADSVVKDLLFEASRFDLTLNFRLYSNKEVTQASKRHLYVLTYFGGTRVLAAVSGILAEEGANIETITSLTQQCPDGVEMVLNVNHVDSMSRLKSRIMTASHELNFDLALQNIDSFRKSKRLIFFDMDSTLVDQEVIDELARLAGVGPEVARVTEKAMRGDYDFEESLIQRVALLKGLKVEALNEVRQNIRFSEGAEDVAITLKALGYKLVVVSGGFQFFTQHLKEILGFDLAFANQLEIKDGLVTGRLKGDIIDPVQKARIVNQVAQQMGILLDQTVAVGDGSNDALMLGQAGLGIAYNAKPALDRVANVSLGHSRLQNILYLLGITESDIRHVLSRELRCESETENAPAS